MPPFFDKRSILRKPDPNSELFPKKIQGKFGNKTSPRTFFPPVQQLKKPSGQEEKEETNHTETSTHSTEKLSSAGGDIAQAKTQSHAATGTLFSPVQRRAGTVAGAQTQPDLAMPASEHKAGIAQFRQANPDVVLQQKQAQLSGQAAQKKTEPSAGNSNTIQRCARAPAPFAPATGKKTTELKGTYGEFKVEHGLILLPTDKRSGEYEIQITMTPNEKTKGSTISFLQTVRRGTTPGNWSTKKDDSGMTDERAKRTTKDGYRVDRADATTTKSPFYGTVNNGGGTDKLDYATYGNAAKGEYKGNNPSLYDKPNVLDPSVLEFLAMPIDMTYGTAFGAVAWGFEYDSASQNYKETTPYLAAPGDARLKGHDDAIAKWNKEVATDKSGILKVPQKPQWVATAEAEIGQKEVVGKKHNPRVLEYHKTVAGKISTDETPWCSSFVNWVMTNSGAGGTNSARALSWKGYGTESKTPAYGSIAVISWGGGKGHVGIVVGTSGNSVLLLGGNQSNAVNISPFAKSKIVSYRLPPGYEPSIDTPEIATKKKGGGSLKNTR